jgi:transglutaminase-like putative cysteine protease
MLIRLGYELVFEMPAPVPMQLMLYVHPSRAADLRRPDRIRLEPDIPLEDFTDGFGNHCARILAPAGRLRITNDTLIEDDGQPDPIPQGAQANVQDLPVETLPYLMASRYCEVDRLSDIAWSLFGQTPPGWPRVKAICDWVHDRVRFGYGFARPTKTAHDVFEEGQGVCRDFMHLAITFLRCMNIPARYATGYLGDIRVPAAPFPMDFSAWLEVYLGDRWWTWDARHNVPRVGRVLMARGRDAVDVALTTSFGPTLLKEFTVWSDEIAETSIRSPSPEPVSAG